MNVKFCDTNIKRGMKLLNVFCVLISLQIEFKKFGNVDIDNFRRFFIARNQLYLTVKMIFDTESK